MKHADACGATNEMFFGEILFEISSYLGFRSPVNLKVLDFRAASYPLT